VSQRRELSSIVGLVAPVGRARDRARRYARHVRGSIHGAQVIAALRYFRRRIGRPFVVVWDRLNAHRATAVAAFVAAHPHDYALEWLPPYAPNLNPEELCNGAVKQELLNAAPGSVDEPHRVVRRGFIRLGRRPAVLHRFFQHTGLAVTHFS
jgi:transposase